MRFFPTPPTLYPPERNPAPPPCTRDRFPDRAPLRSSPQISPSHGTIPHSPASVPTYPRLPIPSRGATMPLNHDLRYALRLLTRSRLSTTLAILSLALGIGATTAIFSVVYAVLID